MRGRPIPLSRPRRVLSDLVAFADANAKAVIRRSMRLGPLAAAMAARDDRPPWSALFVRGFALVARDEARFRRAYVKLPWPQLYEYPVSVAAVAMERELDGEPALFFARIKAPETMSLADIGAELRRMKAAPIESVTDFRRMLRIASLPLPIRRLLWWLGVHVGRQRANFFGSFGVSTVAGEGAMIDATFNPVTTTITYAPLNAAGEIDVAFTFDHRVFDGSTVARGLEALEKTLLGPVLDEVREGVRPALHIVAGGS